MKTATLLTVAVLTLVFSLYLTNAGHLQVDEMVYHLMARDFAHLGNLSIRTGFEEFASPELSYPVTVAHEGRLVPQYPSLYPILSAPFYWVAGYRGLFILNALALLGVAGLCFAIAQRLFRDSDLSINACLILLLASFAWEYSQASWPHAVATLFVCGAVFLVILAFEAGSGTRSLWLANLAGLVAGFGTGIRVDVCFVMPALVLPFLFIHPMRLWHVLAVLAGTVPGLASVAVTNYLKFGILSPFTYGPKPAGTAVEPMSYVPILVAGIVVVAVVWVLTRPQLQERLRPRRHLAWGGGLAAGAAALVLVPELWAIGIRFADGAYQLLVDFRIRDLSIVEGGLKRSPGGGMMYMGAFKKSLLQSCPYLVVLVVPIWHLLRGGKDALSIGLLAIVPASFFGIFSYFAWHGGLGLNLRYFMPILPFTSILVAYTWRELTGCLIGRRRACATAAALGGLMLALWIFVLPPSGLSLADREFALLTAPLLLASGLLAVVVIWLISENRARQLLGQIAVVTVVLGFVWSGMVALTYDFPAVWRQRSMAGYFFDRAAHLVSPDSLVFADFINPVTGLYDLDRVRLAHVTRDDFQSFRPLADFHLDAGRQVYAWLHPKSWELVRERGLLDALEIEPLKEIGGRPLARITRPARAGFVQPADDGRPAGAGPQPAAKDTQ